MNTTIIEATATITVPIDIEKIREAIDGDAWPGINYWAGDFVTSDDGLTVEDKYSEETRTATWAQVAEALGFLASGTYHWGDTREVRKLGNTYQLQALRALIFEPADADYDADTMDTLIQEAVLGSAIYG